MILGMSRGVKATLFSVLGTVALIGSVAAPAQVQPVDPDRAIDGDLAGPKPARRVAIEKLLQSQLQRTPGIVAMLLTNAQGLVLADPLGVPPGTSVTDRQYFQTLRQSRSQTRRVRSLKKVPKVQLLHLLVPRQRAGS